MSHCDITLRDRYSSAEQLGSRIDILTVEKKRLESLLDAAESNLNSIFERVKEGQVYLTGSPNNPKSP